MKTVWITYSWEDNKNNDVEFIAQELEKVSIAVKLDRWNIKAGKRLWEQIDNFITNPLECDAWIIIATPNSLGSEACKEEIAYALDRALNCRGAIFPIIALFQSSIDNDLIPASIKTRLHISMKDDNWIERISSAVNDQTPNITRQNLSPYYFDHKGLIEGMHIIEIRPRAGTWGPFYCGVPINEKEFVKPIVRKGPKGYIPPISGIVIGEFSQPSTDKEWWILGQTGEVTPTQSCFFYCKNLPSEIIFGCQSSLEKEYFVKFSNL